jgi:hypothetical protein
VTARYMTEARESTPPLRSANDAISYDWKLRLQECYLAGQELMRERAAKVAEAWPLADPVGIAQEIRRLQPEEAQGLRATRAKRGAVGGRPKGKGKKKAAE